MSYFKISRIKENKIWIAVGIILLLLINVRGLNQMKVPTILHDEMGYWTTAAYFAGYRWSGITEVFSYYAYGPGIVFSIFIRLFQDMVKVYQAAICFNVVLMFVIYGMAYKICGMLFKDTSCMIRVLAAVVSLCYPSYIMNVGIAWAEYFILFAIWINIFIFIKLLNSQSVLKIILYGVSICYLYVLHQRNVAVVAVGIFTIIYLFIKKKITNKNVILFFGVLFCALIIHKYVKNNIINDLWITQEFLDNSVSANDYSGRINNMIYSLCNAGVGTFFESFLGKIYYLIIASGGLYIGGVISGFRTVKQLAKDHDESNRNIVIIYINMIVLSLTILCSIATMADGIHPSRIDGLVYGRYVESAIGPLLMLGIMDFYQFYYSGRLTAINCILTLGLALMIVHVYRTGMFVDRFVESCSGGLYRYYDMAGRHSFVFLGTMITIGIIVIVTQLFNTRKEALVLCGFFTILVIYAGNGDYLNRNCRNQIQYNNQKIIKLAENINRININAPIYCIRGDEKWTYMYLEILQYLLPGYGMSYVEENAFCLDTENYYLLVENTNSIDMDQYVELEEEDCCWHVLVKKNTVLYNQIMKKEKNENKL